MPDKTKQNKQMEKKRKRSAEREKAKSKSQESAETFQAEILPFAHAGASKAGIWDQKLKLGFLLT